MVIAANVLLAIAAVAHVHAAVAATLVSYQVIRKRRRRGKQQRRSAAWSLMHEQLRAPTDEDEDPLRVHERLGLPSLPPPLTRGV